VTVVVVAILIQTVFQVKPHFFTIFLFFEDSRLGVPVLVIYDWGFGPAILTWTQTLFGSHWILLPCYSNFIWTVGRRWVKLLSRVCTGRERRGTQAKTWELYTLKCASCESSPSTSLHRKEPWVGAWKRALPTGTDNAVNWGSITFS
jgi:hypothetical protein